MTRTGMARVVVTAVALLAVVGLLLVVGPRGWRDAVFGAGAGPATATATASTSASPTATPTPTSTPPPVLAGVATEADPTAAGVSAALSLALSDPALGPGVGAAVSSSRGDLLLDVDATTPRTPASTAKILTAIAALEALGPDARFTTSVELVGPARLVLVGGGDPALSQRPAGDQSWSYPTTSLEALARQTAEVLSGSGVDSVTLGYRADLFTGPNVSPDWESGYVPSGQVGPVSALAIDGGREQPGLAGRSPDPAANTALRFAQLLGSYGVAVQGVPDVAPVGAPAPQLAALASPTVAELVAQLLVRSDNDVAEVLAHHVARAEGLEPSFAGASQAVPAVLTRLGIPVVGLKLDDGSGLSRGSLVSPATLVAALQLALDDDHPSLRPVLAALPVAGLNGTLQDRFADPESGRQVGDVRAKTGFLSGVLTLAGYVIDEEGRPLVFALMADGVERDATLDAQLAIDRTAAALATCGCD